MSTRAERIERAARALVGAPFRLHGRDAAGGVDCIGLVVLSLKAAGCPAERFAPAGYSVRGGLREAFDAALRAAGLRAVTRGRAGDIVLVQSGVAQMHLMIAVTGGHVHAHASLGHVVEMPGPSPWREIGRWRWGR